MADRQEAILAEYASLRQEITQASQINLQGTTIALTIAAGIIAYGFQSPSSIAFLATIAVLLSALLFNTYVLATIIRGGAYIYALIEPKVEGLQWETMLTERRRRDKVDTGVIFTLVVSNVVSLSCVVFGWVFVKDRSTSSLATYWSVAFFLLFALLITSINIVRIISPNFYDKTVKSWKRIEEEYTQIR
jgi:hypothetical protein